MFDVMKGKNPQPRILYLVKLPFRFERELKISKSQTSAAPLN